MPSGVRGFTASVLLTLQDGPNGGGSGAGEFELKGPPGEQDGPSRDGVRGFW